MSWRRISSIILVVVIGILFGCFADTSRSEKTKNEEISISDSTQFSNTKPKQNAKITTNKNSHTNQYVREIHNQNTNKLEEVDLRNLNPFNIELEKAETQPFGKNMKIYDFANAKEKKYYQRKIFDLNDSIQDILSSRMVNISSGINSINESEIGSLVVYTLEGIDEYSNSLPSISSINILDSLGNWMFENNLEFRQSIGSPILLPDEKKLFFITGGPFNQTFIEIEPKSISSYDLNSDSLEVVYELSKGQRIDSIRKDGEYVWTSIRDGSKKGYHRDVIVIEAKNNVIRTISYTDRNNPISRLSGDSLFYFKGKGIGISELKTLEN